MRIWCLVFAILLLLMGVTCGEAALGGRTLQRGMNGQDVEQLQRTLSDLGFDLVLDGVFGAQTKNAVMEVQAWMGLKVDGIVGSHTFYALNLLSNQLVRHEVAAGDTLYDLARAYGSSVELLHRINNLSSSLIFPGENLRVLPANTAVPVTTGSRVTFQWPLVGRITSPYGWRNHPITKVHHFHGGIDIAAPHDTPVKAAAGGVVIHAGRMGAYGLAVVLDHGAGITSWYGHNSRLLVSVQDRVHTGQVIARVGSTGLATGPHLDFRIKHHGETVNPMEYLP